MDAEVAWRRRRSANKKPPRHVQAALAVVRRDACGAVSDSRAGWACACGVCGFAGVSGG
jgi:hypothetical protein